MYNLPSTEALYTRFVGLNGSAYLVGGFGLSAAAKDEMVVVPIRSGLGARLGINVGYLKFTQEPTWNPFLAPPVHCAALHLNGISVLRPRDRVFQGR